MPLPTPNTGEEQQKFVSRFMADKAMQREYPDKNQRLAVAFSQWRRLNGTRRPRP